MNVLMILPVTSQPRLIKRVEAMIMSGNKVYVAYQIRKYFKKNDLPKGCIHIPLTSVESGKYHKRILKLIKSYLIIKDTKIKYDRIYTFSSDLLFISLFLHCRERYYEIGDLRIINSRVYNNMYGYMLKKQHKIIVTSAMFSQYLQNHLQVSSEKISVIENKLDPTVFNRVYEAPRRFHFKKIKIGIIGFLRYKQIIDFLNALKDSREFIEVHIYGAGTLLHEILEFVDNNSVFYHGEFKYPVDLDCIYDNIDLSFVMYNSDDLNVRLALPNKLYESIYYRKPIIVSSETYLSTKVDEFGVGFKWGIDEMKTLPHKIKNFVESGGYNETVLNCVRVKREEIFVDSHYINQALV